MGISEQVERFVKTPPKVKVAVIVAISVVLGAIFYYLFYDDLLTQGTKLSKQIKAAEAEKAKYEDRKQKYRAFPGGRKQAARRAKRAAQGSAGPGEYLDLLAVDSRPGRAGRGQHPDLRATPRDPPVLLRANSSADDDQRQLSPADQVFLFHGERRQTNCEDSGSVFVHAGQNG